MRFQSIDFLIFLAGVLALYWVLPRRAQHTFLICASCLFYGYVHPWFLILLATSTVTDYCCGLAIVADPYRKRAYLVFSIFVNLGMLAAFK